MSSQLMQLVHNDAFWSAYHLCVYYSLNVKEWKFTTQKTEILLKHSKKEWNVDFDLLKHSKKSENYSKTTPKG